MPSISIFIVDTKCPFCKRDHAVDVQAEPDQIPELIKKLQQKLVVATMKPADF